MWFGNFNNFSLFLWPDVSLRFGELFQGSSEFQFTNELLEGALELEQRIDGIYP